jgi:hypothetical protein
MVLAICGICIEKLSLQAKKSVTSSDFFQVKNSQQFRAVRISTQLSSQWTYLERVRALASQTTDVNFPQPSFSLAVVGVKNVQPQNESRRRRR